MKKIILFTGIILLLVIAVHAIVIEPDTLIVKKINLSLSKWDKRLDNIKIVILADIHAGSPHVDIEKLREIVNLANKQNPDYIFLLGDYVIKNVIGGKFIEPRLIAKELGKLKAKQKVIAVMGNHDWWHNGKAMTDDFEKNNIVVLENNAIKVDFNRNSFWVAGLADLSTRDPDLIKTFSYIKDNKPIIMLSHDPDVFAYMPKRVALTMAGHTHGGQITLPFIKSVITPSIFGQKYAKGLVEENDRLLLVSSGIGTSILPLRLGNPPEIIALTLKVK